MCLPAWLELTEVLESHRGRVLLQLLIQGLIMYNVTHVQYVCVCMCVKITVNL